MRFRFCPRCGGPLMRRHQGGRERQCCADAACGHVFWDNPVPVVAAVVEHEGQLILARNAEWPRGMFALITGFLEANEEPEEGVLREVEEELGLRGEVVEFLGVHSFAMMNQVIFSYFVRAQGDIVLEAELAEYRRLPYEEAWYWPVSTGLVFKEFLEARGFQPQCRELPSAMHDYVERQIRERIQGE